MTWYPCIQKRQVVLVTGWLDQQIDTSQPSDYSVNSRVPWTTHLYRMWLTSSEPHPETIPRTFPMTWTVKFNPHNLHPFVILRSLRPEVEILFRLEMRCIVGSFLQHRKLFVLNQGIPSLKLLRCVSSTRNCWYTTWVFWHQWGFLSYCFNFIIPVKLEILVKTLLVENIMKFEPVRNKLLRGPEVMLFVIGNLKEHNPIPFTVSQILSLYKTDLPIRHAGSVNYVTVKNSLWSVFAFSKKKNLLWLEPGTR